MFLNDLSPTKVEERRARGPVRGTRDQLVALPFPSFSIEILEDLLTKDTSVVDEDVYSSSESLLSVLNDEVAICD